MTRQRIPNSMLDITLEDHVAQIVFDIESQENRDRKRAAYEDFQIRSGNQRHFVEKRLKEIYPETYKKFRLGDISIAKKIIDKLSVAYKVEPKRELESEKESEDLNALYKEFKFNRALQEFDEIFNYHKYACLWLNEINPDPERGIEEFMYRLLALAPFEYDIVFHEITGEPIIFILNFPDRNIVQDLGYNEQNLPKTVGENEQGESNVKKYSLWSAKSHSQVLREVSENDGDSANITFDFIDIPGNANNENPIGRLPIAFLASESSGEYPVPSNLGTQSREWNISFSDYKTAASTQGFGQLIVSHPEGQKQKVAHLGMHTGMSLPQSLKEGAPSTTAQFINANPDLAGQLDGLKFEVSNILDEHGIKAKAGMDGDGGNFASALDRQLANADTTEIVEGNQSLYKECVEAVLYDLVRAAEESLGRARFSSDDLMVVYPKADPIISMKDLLEEIRMKQELGVIEEFEKLMILNPNLTPEQAQEKLAKIKVEQKERMQEMAEAMGEMEGDDEDEAPEVAEDDA